jgi:hypothetical protein
MSNKLDYLYGGGSTIACSPPMLLPPLRACYECTASSCSALLLCTDCSLDKRLALPSQRNGYVSCSLCAMEDLDV